jgi:hypothetical protein
MCVCVCVGGGGCLHKACPVTVVNCNLKKRMKKKRNRKIEIRKERDKQQKDKREKKVVCTERNKAH